MKSKIKALTTYSTPSEALTPTHERIIASAIDWVIESIPDEAFTGLSTKAKVTVSSAAAWEKTRADSGTIGAVHDIMQLLDQGHNPVLYDLDSGKPIGHVSKDAIIGEKVFWACLGHVLSMTDEEMTSVMLSVAKEPGKGRTVTKGTACLKIVLDCISGICAKPMEAGLDTSKSGMGKSAHTWNLFKQTFQNAHSDMIFQSMKKTVEDQTAEGPIFKELFAVIYGLSTDYEEATDHENHKVARMISYKYMRRCGIPRMLVSIALKVIGKGRWIYFHGTGPLKKIGEPYEGNIRRIWMVRGILMGDPFTKLTLHIINACVRMLITEGHKPERWSKYFANPEEICKYFAAHT